MDTPRYTDTPERLLKLKKAIEVADRQGHLGNEGDLYITISDGLAKAICELLEDAIREIDPTVLKEKGE